MSDSETKDVKKTEEKENSDEKSTSYCKYKKIIKNLCEKFANEPDILKLLRNLEKQYSKKKNDLKKVKSKLKEIKSKKRKTKDVGCQTEYMEAEISWDIDDEEKPINIAEQVKEAAESALQETGMVYEPTSGMYYDYNTGYYYNAILGLYYHSSTGCYYTYNKTTSEFTFHSQADISHFPITEEQAHHSERTLKNKRKKELKKERLKEKRKRLEELYSNDDDMSDMDECDSKLNNYSKKEKGKLEKYSSKRRSRYDEKEEGEYSDNTQPESLNSSSSSSEDECISNKYPPCIRIIVQETQATGVKEGSLYIMTKEGGTIGREGNDHAFIIPELLISKKHLKMNYDEQKKSYFVIDLGSRNGSFLDGKLIPTLSEENLPVKILHGSIIHIGSTKLLCHIHKGNQTCGHCEPGLIASKDENQDQKNIKVVDLKTEHKKELQRLKTKYCLTKSNGNEEVLPEGYEDRAQKRRDVVGSSHEGEKTEQASLDTSIASNNKGFKMLEKMGWSAGKGLGKETQGETEPVPLVSNSGTAGLGSNINLPIVPKNFKTTIWINAQKRFQKLQTPAPLFEQDDDEDEEEKEKESEAKS